MPCWQTNRLIYAKIEIRPAILKRMLPILQEEALASGLFVKVGEKITITIPWGVYTLDPKTGQAKYPVGMEPIHNLVKRCYSMATVQSVAAKSQVHRAFKTKKVDSRNLVMTRR